MTTIATPPVTEGAPSPIPLSHPDTRVRSSRGRIGWIVAGSLASGLLAAGVLVAAPFIPPTEAGLTGAVLCGLALAGQRWPCSRRASPTSHSDGPAYLPWSWG